MHWHLFHAKKAGIDDVVTIDQQTILSKASQLEAQFGIRVWRPSEFSSSLSSEGRLTTACSGRALLVTKGSR